MAIAWASPPFYPDLGISDIKGSTFPAVTAQAGNDTDLMWCARQGQEADR
jgi:hypothetical protein